MKFDLFYFCLALFIGMFFVYVKTKDPKIIFINPVGVNTSPDIAHNPQYTGKSCCFQTME